MEYDSTVVTHVKQYPTISVRKISAIISTTSKHPFYQTISFKGTIESIHIKLKWDGVVLKSTSLI